MPKTGDRYRALDPRLAGRVIELVARHEPRGTWGHPLAWGGWWVRQVAPVPKLRKTAISSTHLGERYELVPATEQTETTTGDHEAAASDRADFFRRRTP